MSVQETIADYRASVKHAVRPLKAVVKATKAASAADEDAIEMLMTASVADCVGDAGRTVCRCRGSGV